MDEENEQDITCSICCQGFSSDELSVRVSNKGLNTLVQFAELHSNLALQDHFTRKREQSIPVLVHKICCRDFMDKKRLVQTEDPGLMVKRVKRSYIYIPLIGKMTAFYVEKQLKMKRNTQGETIAEWLKHCHFGKAY